jgi:hypothetical protein
MLRTQHCWLLPPCNTLCSTNYPPFTIPRVFAVTFTFFVDFNSHLAFSSKAHEHLGCLLRPPTTPLTSATVHSRCCLLYMCQAQPHARAAAWPHFSAGCCSFLQRTYHHKSVAHCVGTFLQTCSFHHREHSPHQSCAHPPARLLTRHCPGHAGRSQATTREEGLRVSSCLLRSVCGAAE